MSKFTKWTNTNRIAIQKTTENYSVKDPADSAVNTVVLASFGYFSGGENTFQSVFGGKMQFKCFIKNKTGYIQWHGI